MKHSWFIPMTPKQAETLKKGLKDYFRFELSLAFETVSFDKKDNTLTITLTPGTVKVTELLTHISCYINGFAKAIEK